MKTRCSLRNYKRKVQGFGFVISTNLIKTCNTIPKSALPPLTSIIVNIFLNFFAKIQITINFGFCMPSLNKRVHCAQLSISNVSLSVFMLNKKIASYRLLNMNLYCLNFTSNIYDHS